ncbi:hypothetical protein D3C87_1302070 [compost metagenome]
MALASLVIMGFIRHQSGVVDEDMQGAETRVDPVEHGVRFSARRDVTTQRQALRAQPLDHAACGFKRRLVDVANDHTGAFAGHAQGDGLAQPTCTTGNQRNSTIQFHGNTPSYGRRSVAQPWALALTWRDIDRSGRRIAAELFAAIAPFPWCTSELSAEPARE